MTGKALVFLKGTNYLIHNLVISLSLAIFLIASFYGIPVSLLQNDLNFFNPQHFSTFNNGWINGVFGNSHKTIDHLGF